MIVTKTTVPLLWLVLTSNLPSACSHSALWRDLTLDPFVAVISGALQVTSNEREKGREIVQNDQDLLMWLVVASIFGQRGSLVSTGEIRPLTFP